MKKKDQWFLGLIVLLLGILPIGLYLMSLLTSPEAQLRSFLAKTQASPQEQAAYEFALKHPEVLEKIPCFCGCGEQGHKSNKSCFLTEDAEKAKTQPFDEHGLVCPMCVQIALAAQQMHTQGIPLKEIRERVDTPFKKYPHLHPTPTPKP